MPSDFTRALAFTLHEEGGWSDNPFDRGGPTACGITLSTFRTLGFDNDGDGDIDVEDLKKITPAQVEGIYQTSYWSGFPESLPWPCSLVAFDTAVNSGARRAIKCFQEALGVTADGSWGPKSREAMGKADPLTIARAACDSRERFFRAIGTGDQTRFLQGWLNRLARLRVAVKVLG